MRRSTSPAHVFLNAADLVPGTRCLRPTPATTGEVHVVVDGLTRLETGTLACLLQVYAELLSRGASAVSFHVDARVATELSRLGLTKLVASTPSTFAMPLAA